MSDYLTRGGFNIDLGSRDVEHLIHRADQALRHFRKVLGLSTNDHYQIVRMTNSTGRSTVGVLMNNANLHAFYDTKNAHMTQVHIDATMCVVSWDHERLERENYSTRSINIIGAPLYIPNKLKDEPIYFLDSTILAHITSYAPTITGVERAALINELITKLPKMVEYVKKDTTYLRARYADEVMDYVAKYGRLVSGQSMKDFPPIARLTDKWVQDATLILKGQIKKDHPEWILFPFIKRCIYRVAKDGYIA